MDTVLMQWLAAVGWTAFTWALAGLLVVNGAAAVLFVMRGNRDLVQRWTTWWLAVNLLLVAVGVGVPTITTVTRLAITAARAVAPNALWAQRQTPD